MSLEPNFIEENIINSHKTVYELSSVRAKKRMNQMQKRKQYLNEVESPKFDTPKTTSPEQLTASSPDTVANTKEVHATNPFTGRLDEDAEVNVSNLDCSVEIHEDEENTGLGDCLKNSSINFGSTQKKSFIPLNNNLIAKASFQRNHSQSTPSYILALCPEMCYGKNNYEVDDVIKEENEVESPVKKVKPMSCGKKPLVKCKYSSDFCKKGKKFIRPPIMSLSQQRKHAKSNSCFNIDLVANFVKKQKEAQSKKTSAQNHSYRLPPSPPRKPKHMRQQSIIIPNDYVNKSKDIFDPSISKKIIHKKSRTSYATSSIYSNTISSQMKIKNTSSERITKIKIPHPPFSKAAKINYSLQGGHTNSLSTDAKAGNSILFTSKSQVENSNRGAILEVMNKLKFTPLSTYTQALTSVKKSKKDLFCILVFRDHQTGSYGFKGVYEIRKIDNEQVAQKIYSYLYCPLKIKGKDVNSFISYNKSKGLFYKCKTTKGCFDRDTLLMI